MSHDLGEQVAVYGDWLQRTCCADLRSPAIRTGGADVDAGRGAGDSERAREARSGRTRLRVAAALLVVVGIGGVIAAQRDTDPPAAAAQYTSAIDPTAHLFVLPTDPRGLELSSGEASAARPVAGDATLRKRAEVLIGTEVDGGYSDLVDVAVTSALPAGFGVDGSTEIDTPTGPALVAVDRLPFQRLAQQRGGFWLLMTGATGNQDLIDLLPGVSLDESGSLAIHDDRRVVVEELSRDPLATDHPTSYDITDPSSGISFYVETAVSPSAIVLGAYTPYTVMSTTVNGTPAWILSRDGDPPEAGTAIAWRVTPNRIVAISAQAPLDEIRGMAERLQQVSDQEWLASIPGARIQD